MMARSKPRTSFLGSLFRAALGICALWGAGWFAFSSGFLRLAPLVNPGRAVAAEELPHRATKSAEPVPASAAEEGPAEPLLSGAELLEQTCRQLAARTALTVRLRQTLRLRDHLWHGTGLYQQGPGGRQFLDLQLQLAPGQPPSVRQQICDGQTWWDYENVLGERSYQRLDRARILAAQRAAGATNVDALTLLDLRGGGLPALLSTLQRDVDFTQVSRLAPRTEAAQASYLLIGQWKVEALPRLLPAQAKALEAGRPPNWQEAPLSIPRQIVLQLGVEDLFPYFLEFQRETPLGTLSLLDDDAEPTWSPLLTLELFDVQYSVLDPTAFDLPTIHNWQEHARDVTNAYLKRHGLVEKTAN